MNCLAGSHTLLPRTTFLKVYQPFKQKLSVNACRARTDETCLLHAKMETQDLPKNQTPRLCRSLGDKNTRQLPNCADRS